MQEPRHSAHDGVALLRQHFAHALAQVALDLDSVVANRAARVAGAFKFATQVFQERGVARQVVNVRKPTLC